MLVKQLFKRSNFVGDTSMRVWSYKWNIAPFKRSLLSFELPISRIAGYMVEIISEVYALSIFKDREQKNKAVTWVKYTKLTYTFLSSRSSLASKCSSRTTFDCKFSATTSRCPAKSPSSCSSSLNALHAVYLMKELPVLVNNSSIP